MRRQLIKKIKEICNQIKSQRTSKCNTVSYACKHTHTDIHTRTHHHHQCGILTQSLHYYQEQERDFERKKER